MTAGSASLSVFLAQPLNPGPTAQLYSSLAAVLAGFAFTGLMLFLNAEFKADTKSSRSRSKSVVSTLFCAMSSLTICAFLYGRAAGESESTGRTFLTLALYGVVLAPAVLSLFYALNLVMLSRKATARAAVDTRWVVAAVGPAVVMSLLADLLANAWAYGCDGCPMWTSPRLWGFVFAGSFLVFGLMTSLLAADIADRPWLKPVKYPVERFLDLKPVVAAARFFRNRRSSPAFITLNLTWVVAVLSLWTRGIPDGFSTRAWTHVLLGFAALVMGVFAFAAGSVLDESVFGNSPRRHRSHRSREGWGATAAGPDLNRRDKPRRRSAPRLGWPACIRPCFPLPPPDRRPTRHPRLTPHPPGPRSVAGDARLGRGELVVPAKASPSTLVESGASRVGSRLPRAGRAGSIVFGHRRSRVGHHRRGGRPHLRPQ